MEKTTQFRISTSLLFFAAASIVSAADRRQTPEYLDRQIRRISDADLFAALDLARPEMAKVKTAVEAADYRGAYHASGEPKYLAEFDRLFNTWYEQRDQVQGAIRGLDVIWYELGLGLRNRQFLHYYRCPFRDRPLETHERTLKTTLGAARWLYELQRKGYRGGNSGKQRRQNRGCASGRQLGPFGAFGRGGSPRWLAARRLLHVHQLRRPRRRPHAPSHA